MCFWHFSTVRPCLLPSKRAVLLYFMNDDLSCWLSAFVTSSFPLTGNNSSLLLNSLCILVADVLTEEYWNQQTDSYWAAIENGKLLIDKWWSLTCCYRPVGRVGRNWRRGIWVFMCVCERESERGIHSVRHPCMWAHPSLQYYKSDNKKSLLVWSSWWEQVCTAELYSVPSLLRLQLVVVFITDCFFHYSMNH